MATQAEDFKKVEKELIDNAADAYAARFEDALVRMYGFKLEGG